MPAVQRFARVLRAPDVARPLGAAVLARMPIGIDSLATVLFVRAETGSFARAGLVAAALLGAGPRPAHRPPRARAGHAGVRSVPSRRRGAISSSSAASILLSSSLVQVVVLAVGRSMA